MMALTGCAETGSDSNTTEPEFEAETEPKGSINVSDQRGQGEEIEIGSAEANVDYRIVIEYEGGTVNSSVISANQRVSTAVGLDAQIRAEQTVRVSVVSTDGDVLASSSFQYTPVPPGPKMSADEVRRLVQEKVGLLQNAIHEKWRDDVTVESDVDGYRVSFGWVHGYAINIPLLKSKKAVTERQVAKANAAFLQALYDSEFTVRDVEIDTFQLRGHDETGEAVIEPSGGVSVTRSSAEQVDWKDLLQHGEFPAGLRQVVDEYEFEYHEPLE